jgi:hypothetical protein
VKLCNRRNSSDTITAKLRNLPALSVIHVHEPGHVAYDKLLNVVIGLPLPTGLQSVECQLFWA